MATYDQFGLMTQKTRGGETATYYYHYGDKLTKVASNFGGEGTVTYTVGGDQKRRSRAVTGGDTTKYRYGAGWDVLNEENGSGTLQATYVHHPGKQIGTVLATSEGTSAATGTWNYYFQDAIGSTRGLWDQDGDRIGKYEYTPFGGKYADHGEDITRKFTGHAWDSEARLYYTAYRYYSPDANRWLTRDPLGMVDGPNVYAYVVNNPVMFWDALGRMGCSPNSESDTGIPDWFYDGVGFAGCMAEFILLLYTTNKLRKARSAGRSGAFNSLEAGVNNCMACLAPILMSFLMFMLYEWANAVPTAEILFGALFLATVTVCSAGCVVLWTVKEFQLGWAAVGLGGVSGLTCGATILNRISSIV